MNRNREAEAKLPDSSRWLLVINTLFAGASALSNIFLNIYFWKKLHHFEQIAVYNFFIFFFTALGYVTAGWLAKRTDRLYTLRIGVALLAAFYILILTLGSQAAALYALLGSFLGFGTGFYWLSINVLVFEVTEPDTRDEFNGANAFSFALASVSAPMLAGKILTMLPERGYYILFLISFVLFVAAAFCTRFLQSRKGPSFYNLYAGFRPKEHGVLWRQTLTMAFSMGFREGTLAFLPFLLVFVVTKNELLAGRYLMITALSSLVANYFVKRFLNNERRALFVTAAALMLGASVLWLLVEVNTAALFVFGVVNSLFSPLLTTPYSCLTYDVMGRLPEAVHRKVEYVVMREMFVNFGRCLCLMTLIVSESYLSDRWSVRFAFLLVGLSPLFGLLYFRRASETFRNAFSKIRC